MKYQPLSFIKGSLRPVVMPVLFFSVWPRWLWFPCLSEDQAWSSQRCYYNCYWWVGIWSYYPKPGMKDSRFSLKILCWLHILLTPVFITDWEKSFGGNLKVTSASNSIQIRNLAGNHPGLPGLLQGGHSGSNWNARGPFPPLELNQTRTGLGSRGQVKWARHCQHPFLSLPVSWWCSWVIHTHTQACTLIARQLPLVSLLPYDFVIRHMLFVGKCVWCHGQWNVECL